MPIYIYRCPGCGAEQEELRSFDDPGPNCHGWATEAHEPTRMVRIPAAASFGFKTAGGNFAWFSPSHGAVTKGNRKPKTITTGDGLGGHRPHASPKNNPEFRAALAKKITEG